MALKAKFTMYHGDAVVGNITYGYGHKKLSFSGSSVSVSGGNIDYQSSTLVFAPTNPVQIWLAPLIEKASIPYKNRGIEVFLLI